MRICETRKAKRIWEQQIANQSFEIAIEKVKDKLCFETENFVIVVP